MIRAEEIEVQRQIVRKAPFRTKEYDREFDKLHKMCMEYIAELYVRIYGESWQVQKQHMKSKRKEC